MTSDGTALIASPQLRRAQQIVQDLIIAAFERSTHRRGQSLSLTRFQYAYDENNGEKCCTHYDILVKDHVHNDTTALTLTIAVNSYLEENSQC